MTRRILLSAFVTSALAAPASAGLAPLVPRVPASVISPQADAPPMEAPDPAALAERIAANTKSAGDRLRDLDAGADTRKTQDQVLRDLDELLKRAENPPPPPKSGGGDGNDQNPNAGPPPPPDNGPSGSNSGGPNNPGGSQPKPGGGKPMPPPMGTGSDGQPGGGLPMAGQSGEKPSRGSWRERFNGGGRGDQRADAGNQPKPDGAPMGPMPGGAKPMGGTPSGPPMPGGAPGSPGPGGGPGDGGRGGTSPPAPPLDEAVTKQVWGHLPERLRQQMSQYYREQFVSKYGDLLRDYYSTLAEREKGGRR